MHAFMAEPLKPNGYEFTDAKKNIELNLAYSEPDHQ